MKENESNYKQPRKTNWGRFIIISILILATIAGLAMMLTPYLDSLSNKKEVTQNVTSFKELVSVYKTEEVPEATDETVPIQYPELLAAMQAYNEEIYKNGQSNLVDAWSYQSDVFNLKDYGFESDTVGIMTIPDISVEMPLYLGASYKNLAKGFAQLSQTSMPIGGINTNCAIAGHRGWNGMPYMRDVEMLELGDSIYIENPWETLEYRISKILLIEPSDIDTILIQEGKDLLTIITCHPYGVGSHRYILICERYEEEEVIVPEITKTLSWEWQDRVAITVSEELVFESSQLTIFITEYLPWLCLAFAVGILLVALIVFLTSRLFKRIRSMKN